MKKKQSSRLKTRSGFEDVIIKQLKNQRVPFDYEPKKLLYRLSRYYVPDFELPNKILIEAKGNFDKEDRDKMLAVREMNPEFDIRLVFQSDGYINKLSKTAKKKRLDIRSKRGKVTREETEILNKNRTKYSDWCIEHGFKYAFGKIPLSWIEE